MFLNDALAAINVPMKRSILGMIAFSTLFLLGGCGGCGGLTGDVWPYNHRDQGGNIVLVTKKFDLILVNQTWTQDASGFRAGNGVLVVRGHARLSVSHSGLPNPILKANNRLEMTFPNLSAAILDGKSLEIGGQIIPLGEKRVQVIVQRDGSLRTTDAPQSEFAWGSIEYIKALSAKLQTDQTVAESSEQQ